MFKTYKITEPDWTKPRFKSQLYSKQSLKKKILELGNKLYTASGQL